MQDNGSQGQESKGGMDLMLRYHPFHELLGMTIEPTDDDSVRIVFPMRDDLCGHPGLGILYGGVVACMIDIIGGAIVSWHRIKDVQDRPLEEQIKRMSAIRTVDLRVDYLRAGRGRDFTVTGSILRDGKKVVVTRMEFTNEQGELIASGTGTYIVS
jgi:uncharacterized protein (TIGR00369 family)